LAADEAIIVTTPEPTAMMDAYGMIKVIHLERKDPLIRLIVNMAGSAAEAEEAGKKLVLLAKRFLNLDMEYAGYIPRDMAMVRAVKEQRTGVDVTADVSGGPKFASPCGIVVVRRVPRPETEKSQLGQFFRRVTQLFGGRSYGR
jgi:MinD-like ATPase involved in chromosome partitioning or flagellar assembly